MGKEASKTTTNKIAQLEFRVLVCSSAMQSVLADREIWRLINLELPHPLLFKKADKEKRKSIVR